MYNKTAYLILFIFVWAYLPLYTKEKPLSKAWPKSVKQIKYTASIDSTQQPMLMSTAKSKDKRPLLVALHTWSGNYRQAGGEVVYAKWCLENDWHFVHPNFRGPNRSPDACGSEKAVQDIIDVVDYMKKYYKVDEDRIYCVGVSGGGHAALLLAGRAPEIWAGVSAWVPISDIYAWWDECSMSRYKKYAAHIEKVVGGKPDRNSQAAEECVKRSPITYLSHAKSVNLDINAGVYDGRKGSVPFKHSLYAFNEVANAEDRIDENEIEAAYENMKAFIRKHKERTVPDHMYGKLQPIYRKTSNNARVTIFNGGHQIIHKAALNWLATQKKGKQGVWNIATEVSIKTSQKDSQSGL